MTVIEKITKELEAFNQKKKDLTEDLRKEFPTLFKDLFAQSEVIESFGWTQYTPYFNDGDSCEFGVHQDEIYINEEHEDDLDWYSWTVDHAKYGEEAASNPDINLVESRVINAIKKVLNTIPDEFYQELFGDHVKVTVHKNGQVDTDGYSHD